jgi:hypothetical protein
MKNVKSVRQADGKRLNVQKHLLLVNIDELHRDYKKKLTSDGLRAFGLSVFVKAAECHHCGIKRYAFRMRMRLSPERQIKIGCNSYNRRAILLYGQISLQRLQQGLSIIFKLFFLKFYNQG